MDAAGRRKRARLIEKRDHIIYDIVEYDFKEAALILYQLIVDLRAGTVRPRGWKLRNDARAIDTITDADFLTAISCMTPSGSYCYIACVLFDLLGRAGALLKNGDAAMFHAQLRAVDNFVDRTATDIIWKGAVYHKDPAASGLVSFRKP